MQLSESALQVAVYIAGYITHKLIKITHCDNCLVRLKEDQVTTPYVDTLNRGGLNLPSMSLYYYVETAFCVIEENQHVICSSDLPFKVLACRILASLCSGWDSEFSCVTHKEHHCKMVNCKVANIYFSNLSKKISHTQRKHQVEAFKSRQRQKL